MLNRVFKRQGEEGVTPWVKFAALIGIVSLMLTMLSIAPTQARAEDVADSTASIEEPALVSDANDPVVSTSESTGERPVENDGLDSLEGLDAGPQPLGELIAPLAVNEDIDIEVKSIVAEGKTEGDQITVGDSVVVSGTWDVALSDPADGTQFWVTFPTALEGLEIESPLFGSELLLAEDDSVIGIEVDTATAGDLGEWEVSATASEPTDSRTLNFRTSEDQDLDVSVELPGGEGIFSNGAVPSASVSARAASGDGIQVDITSIVSTSGNPNAQLQPGEHAKVTGTWAAPDDAKAGDRFSITLPEVFAFSDPDPFTLNGPDGIYGNCTIAGAVLTCELTDVVDDLTEVNGTWDMYLEAVRKTADKDVEFQIDGGNPVIVELPGENGGIGQIRPLPTDISKSGSKGSDQRTVTWTVDIPGSVLIAGNAANPATFPDTPSAGQKIVADSGTIQYYDDGDNIVLKDLSAGAGIALGAQDPITNTFGVTINPGETWDANKVYRITYKTITDGLLPEGTRLTNQFGTEGEVGVGGDAGGPVWKSGWFVNGENYQTLQWRIYAPGSAAENGQIVIADELIGGPHEATADTVNSLGVKKNGSAFPGATLVVDNNKHITITIPDAGVADTDVFEVTYRTFYEGTVSHPVDSYPAGGTVFKNRAQVGDAQISAQTSTPAWNSTKSGSLNGSTTTFNDVEYSKNTLLSWVINVSGNKVSNLAPATVTDVLGDNHKVCEGTGDLQQRLGAELKVRDRVTGSYITDHGVTLSVAEGATAQEILYTLTPSADKGFSRNYEYLLTYNTCTASGGQDEYGTKYENSVKGDGIDRTGTVELRKGAGGTGTGVAKGSFGLKKIASSASEKFDRNTEFTFRAEEFGPSSFDAAGNLLPGAIPSEQYNLKIKADGTPVSGIFARGEGWKIRLTEPTLPEGTGFSWAPGIFQAGPGVELFDEGRTAMVSITPRSNVAVVLENTASLGGATITKQVTGPGAGTLTGAERFEVTAFFAFPDGSADSETFRLGNNAAKQLKDLPIGTVVTFEETQPADTDGHTWGAPVFAPESLVIGADTAANAVTLTNTVSVTEGTFALKKVIEGTEADNASVPEDFLITATWDGGSEEITIPANGTVIPFGQNLPTGTQVTLTETIPNDGDNLAWAGAAFTGEGVEIVDGNAVVTVGRGNAEITVTNTVVEMGTLQIIKTISGEAAADVTSEAEFQVLAQWKSDPNANDYTEKTLTLTPGAAVELGVDLPSGTEVRLTEVSTVDLDGVTWGEANWTGSGSWLTTAGDTATVIVSDDPAEGRLVTLDNEAVYAARPVTIEKRVVGDAAELVVSNNYVVTATFPATGEVRKFTINDGTPAIIGAFPVGTVIEFNEVQPENTDQITWGEPVFKPGNRIEIGPNDLNISVLLENVANHTYGTFSVAKNVTGPEQHNPNIPESFEVLAQWVDEEGATQEKTLTVPTSGVAAFGEDLRNGTQVTLTEIVPEDGEGIAWGTPAFSGDVTIDGDSNVVTIGRDAKNVTVTNYADTNTGALRLAKAVNGEAAEAVGENVEFTVEARWNDGSNYQTRELTFVQGETIELGEDLPVGTEVTFTETNLPEIAGVEWGSITWGTNPNGEQWLRTNADGTATGIISDDPNEGRLVTLTNEALWLPGSVSYEKYVFDGETPVLATEADLPEGAEFQVEIESIELPAGKELPEDAGIAQGDIITLNAENNFYWESEKVLPKGTIITFGELDPAPLPGIDWGLPFYYVSADAGEAGDRNVLEIAPDGEAKVEIRNRPIPTTEVEIDKIVTGPKGHQITNDDSTLFQVTASWTDIDGIYRECILDVIPGESAVPTADCNATLVDGKVQFPLNTEITFTETGAYTDVSNVKWIEVIWTINGGAGEIEAVEGEQTSATVTLTGDAAAPVSLELENKTSSNGMIIIPLPIPPLPGGSSTPPSPTTPPESVAPNRPGSPEPTTPPESVAPGRPGSPEPAGANETASPAMPQKGGALASTGANVIWVAGGALLLLAGGTWLLIRSRKNGTSS